MKKLLAVLVVLFIGFSAGFVGLLFGTEIYDDVRESIVVTLCLSCIKLDPVSLPDFIFNTANNKAHPDFVTNNLSNGPIFIEYREDVCAACDDMAPVIKDIFQLEFSKQDIVYERVIFNEIEVVFMQINRDHASDVQSDSLFIYDKDHVVGVPMFTLITLGNNSGIIEPYYTSVYGTLSPLKDDSARKIYLEEILQEAIDLYKENSKNYIE